MSAITIITSTLNALPQLKQTADSIFQQSSKDWQWIIVDGASSDGTGPWLQETAQLYSSVDFISEPDRGIYDAWNKALTLVNGDWVIFMGAGDTFFDYDTLKNCQQAFNDIDPCVTLAYGGVYWVDPEGKLPDYLNYRKWKGLKGPWRAARPAMPCHQGVFQRSSLFNDGFRFDSRLRIAADGELVLRELLAGKGRDLERTIARMLRGGASTHSKKRLHLICETIYVNWKLGIFWQRPLFQIAVLSSNAIKHLFRY